MLGTYEEVNGTIIGAITFKFSLMSPNGKAVCSTHETSDFDGKKWAKEELKNLKATILGNGKTFNEYPDIFKSIYGDGEFTLRSF